MASGLANRINCHVFQLTQVGKVTGAKVMVYLLEHARVVNDHIHDESEKNFHIFDWMLAGLENQNRLDEFRFCH